MKQRWSMIGWRFLGLLLAYVFIRCLFVFYYWDRYSLFSGDVLLSALIYGLRFDVSAILQSNAIFFLLWMTLPTRWLHNSGISRFLFYTFLLWNFALFSLNTADIELQQFNGRRITWDYFQLAQDIGGQAGSVLLYYWKLAMVSVIMVVIYFFGFGQKGPQETDIAQSSKGLFIKGTFSTLLLLVLLVVGIRGGLQLKPLRPTHAFIFHEDGLGNLALNSTFTLLRGKSSNEIHKVYYLPEEDLNKTLKQFQSRSWQPIPEAKGIKNICILIVESLSLEYMGQPNVREGYTPFIDSLIDKSLFYKNHFSNGRRSIEAIPSLLASIPSLMLEPFITSAYQTNKVVGMGSELKKLGYSTHFFHGAENGSMFFDSFTQRLGFDHYYGLNEYPHAEKDFDGNWGVFDEPFLKFAIQRLSEVSTPFLAVAFTLSSHHPYSIPEAYKGRFKKGTLEIHESIQYADESVKSFFNEAANHEWFHETLFIITGDHTQKSEDKNYQDVPGVFRVPLLIYSPKVDLKKYQSEWADHRFSQHVDLMPTLLHWLNHSPSAKTYFGHSLFLPEFPGFAVNTHQEKVWLFDKEGTLALTDDGEIQIDGITPYNSVDERALGLKAYTQYYFNGMIDNSWYAP
ncbi:MAG: LTA synthase family protein [Bdellovibrionales bacterium]|nr:LTA synthase family protein [Bdellovibrionales bacterium]